ncbi:hypothetical protein PCIT_a2514 [Pseudoalteromonas citrea]|uniref:Lipoprotein n=2 Tax=Pseudoalteromonas citrea TaxID=43655 RepID=A0AAD4AK39_9GAMM|nr:hypothetical protein [Pseudoalteromonas citrea]KAF7772446.1 hypothetical protein PCIT_a2514 [Pseudoalteromonas citrea]
MRKSQRQIWLLSTLFFSVGCEQTAPPAPALATIEHPTAIMKAELQSAIVQLKGGVAPRLADGVFSTGSSLLIEQTSNLAGPLESPIYVTNKESVARFELQKRGDLCVLYFPKTQNYVPLEHVKCRPTYSAEK